MRLALILGIVSVLSVEAGSRPARPASASTNVAEHIISLERIALDRWMRADPDGYLSLYAKDATYFDPFTNKRVDGLDELNARMAPMRGAKLPFIEPRYEMLDPIVRLEGNIAVLSFNLVSYGKPSGSTEEKVLARWNATEVYCQMKGTWRIIHAHWSFTQPQLAAQPPLKP